MNLHKEISFEDEICGYLATNGWLYVEGDAGLYDRSRAVCPGDLLAWVQITQPTVWQTLTKNHGASAEGILLDRIRKQLDDRGTLDRHPGRETLSMIARRNELAMAGKEDRMPHPRRRQRRLARRDLA